MWLTRFEPVPYESQSYVLTINTIVTEVDVRFELTNRLITDFLFSRQVVFIHSPNLPNCPTLRLLMSSYFGFLFLKTCEASLIKTSNTTGRSCVRSFISTKSHSRRRLSANPLFKSWIKDYWVSLTLYLYVFLSRTERIRTFIANFQRVA